MEEKRSYGAVVPATILILIGIIFLLDSLGWGPGMNKLWPIFLLAPGVSFLLMFALSKKYYGVLMPGTFLTIISGLFFYCNFFGWQKMQYLWPVFLLAVAAGLFMIYLFSGRHSALLVPVGILTLIALVFLVASSTAAKFWPLILIILGVLIIFGSWKKTDQKKERN